MEKKEFLTSLRFFTLTGIGLISFSNFIMVLFGQTIPSILWSFFKDVGEIFVVTAVFFFAITWFLRARPPTRPKNFSVVMYDVFGNESEIDGLRTQFKTHDVAWSFMKQYKKSYPLFNFALVSSVPKSDKKTIFRYI